MKGKTKHLIIMLGEDVSQTLLILQGYQLRIQGSYG